ncbi:hypothetical protein [uncultured Aquitalea sp.]|uniref:ATP-grasp domain-containing protein n=1 Tax=uncultured Aquitalea sp. TaxID=540272 RepID=UPI0025CDEE65|nr:hypothetical protein [uncultured Aquitalea sp.]
MHFDVVVLTDRRLLELEHGDWYSQQVHKEDGLVLNALAARGLKVCRKAWDDSEFDWRQAGALLFRTTWDYFERYPEFAPWLSAASQATRLFNSAGLIRWNIDKHYLGELAQKGINTVTTHYIEKHDPRTLRQVLEQNGIEDAILKPAISGSARHTYRVSPNNAAELECIFAKLVQQEAMMVQPFQHQVLVQGEISLMVLDGKVSHAIRKTPKHGDFRVQDDHGGSVHEHRASDEETRFAEAAVAAVPHDVLYARVDMVRDNHAQLAIMELEMIEPELFFRFHPEAAEQLADGICRRLGR